MSENPISPVPEMKPNLDSARDAESLLPPKWSDWRLETTIESTYSTSVFRAARKDKSGVSYSAIKVLRIPESRKTARYIREINIMLSLKGHPNIVSIEDYALVRNNGSDILLIRLEWLTPLYQYIAANGHDEAEAIRLGIEICGALEYCRQKGVLHLDIKPGNIFVSDKGLYKLGDFGISCFADELASMPPYGCTPVFSAPELCQYISRVKSGDKDALPDRIGEKCDQYSLGLVLYWLTNRLRQPFMPDEIITPRSKAEAIIRRMRGEPLPPPENASEELAEVLLTACAFSPEDRYSNPAELAATLEKLVRKKT